MSGIHRFSPPAASGLLSALKAWFQPGPHESPKVGNGQAVHVTGQSAPPPPGVRVLVVDDNPVNLMVLSAQMASRGLVPLLAADGAEAVALACGPPFDLILMDLQMPILDGFGATEAIRRFESTCARQAVPVLAFTTSNPAPGILAQHGLNGSLAKPCEDRELEDCLLHWCPTYRAAPRQHRAYTNLSFAQQQPGNQQPYQPHSQTPPR